MRALQARNVSEPRGKGRRLFPGLLAFAALLGMAGSADADVVLRKRVVRHFPSNAWCPFRGQHDLWFVATTGEAKITFGTSPDPGDPDGHTVLLDKLYLVEDTAFEESFRSDPSVGCWADGGAPFFHPESASSSAIAFVEEFFDVDGWTLVNAVGEQDGLGEPALRLGVDPLSPARATVTATGLTPGTRYFVTGWSSDGDLTVTVDTPRPPALFLQNGRFRLEVRHDGSRPAGGAALTEKSAVFWLRDSLKTELIVNVSDRCQDLGTYHVIVGGTTTTRVSIAITDVQTGRAVSYQNPQGTRFQTRDDRRTFRCN